MAGAARDRRDGGGNRVDRLLSRPDVFADRYPVAPPWLSDGAVLAQHVGVNYELWRRDRRTGHMHGVRVSQPYYIAPMPPDLLTARDRVNTRIRERATAFGDRVVRQIRPGDPPLRAETLRDTFTTVDAAFFGAPALVDVRVMRDGRRIGRHVNSQHISPPLPPPDAGIIEIRRVRTARYVNVTVRALHRSLNRAMVNYVGLGGEVGARKWEGLASPDQARSLWPSLSQRAFWSGAAWRRALRLTDPAGEWTLHWERMQDVILRAAVVAQRT